MGKVRVAVVGASGYGGAEAVRLLLRHPNAEVCHVTSARNPGKPLREFCPWLETSLVLEAYRPDFEVDAYLLCQEVGFAAEHAPELESRYRVIDFSADFRLRDGAAFERVYKAPWPNPKLAQQPVYGLPELIGREKIAAARVVANPGCYPTASLLGLKPFLDADFVTGVPVIDAKSGVSGAGRNHTETEYLFTELAADFKAYKPVGHRHVAEIVQLAGIPVRFTPHLLPISRGIEATIHIPLKSPSSKAELIELLNEKYKNEPFIRVTESEPTVKQAVGTNLCYLTADYDPDTQFAVVRSVIDNLGKGAAGQAVQSLNLMFGLNETDGLQGGALWP